MTEYINVVDEQGRFVRLDIYPDGRDMQGTSTTYSYMAMREILQDLGHRMGLNKIELLLTSGEVLWNEEGLLLLNHESGRIK